jgi:LL-diaminopimelate aminotransferase
MKNARLDIKPAYRIADFKPYFFASLNQKIASLKAKNMDIVRLDMGSPDLPPTEEIITSLVNSARKADTHGYTPNGGTPAYRRAIATYYLRRFNIELDPDKEVLGLIGSKEGLFNLSAVLVNDGDVVLVPDPGYPVYATSGKIFGAEVYFMPLLKENQFLPDFQSIPKEIAQRAKILWLNYPNNPTGAVASLEFFEKALDFACEYNLIVAHDAPYVDICFDGYQAPSILQVPGAESLAIEFNSLSKTYNMAGWRLGMVVGNPQVISYLNTYKSQMDSSHFAAILEAAVTALTGDQAWIQERNLIYLQRRDIVISGLRHVGFEVDVPPAAIYVWAKLPDGYTDSMAYCDRMLTEIGVSTTPGIVYGKFGEGYLRISLGTPTHRIEDAMKRISNWQK